MLSDPENRPDGPDGPNRPDRDDHAPAAVTRRARSSFYYAFLILPPPQRRALDAVYAFCRLVDDAVDEAPSAEQAQAALALWRRRLDGVYASARPAADDRDPERPLIQELWQARRAFRLRREDFEAVIEGCDWDATRTRYATWEDLRAYCLRVASAVGLLCIGIFSRRGPRDRDYAIELGLALQLTNILRDLDEDAARGRLYLPLEDLAAFGVAERDLLAGQRTRPILRLLRFEAQRARLHYLRARAMLGPSDGTRLVAAEIMGDIYYALLEHLEAEDFPARKVRLSTARKALLALRRFALTQIAR